MEDYEAARSRILGDDARPGTIDQCDQLLRNCTETMRHLRSEIGACAGAERALARKMRYSVASERGQLDKELSDIWEVKERIESKLLGVERDKVKVRERLYELSRAPQAPADLFEAATDHIVEDDAGDDVEASIDDEVVDEPKTPKKRNRWPSLRPEDAPKITDAQREQLAHVAGLYDSGMMSRREYHEAKKRINEN